MPRAGAIILSDLTAKTIGVVCDKCGRRGRYSVARLLNKHGDIGLPELAAAVSADCPRRGGADFYDRCRARVVSAETGRNERVKSA
jgi:hypothetical protein